MKRIIWIAQDKRHRIISVWWNNHADISFIGWKGAMKRAGAIYITKREVYL